MAIKQRRTQQKEAIENAFTETPRALTVPEVHERALSSCPGLGVATVYRSVNRLVSAQWLREVRLPDQPVRYERADLDHHHHFHCDSCELVLDVKAPCEPLAHHLPDGFSARRHEVIFYGVCGDCSA